MKVVVLGGAGAMGGAAAALVATFPEVSELVLADARAAAAGRAAEVLRRPGLQVSAARVDVLDTAALAAVLAGNDVVLNTTGPFFRLGVPALRAAITARVAYLDICDDPAPTRDMLALHSEAVAAGTTAIVGIGASPGLSNLLAVCATDRLDRVQDLHTAWPVDAGDRHPTDGDSGDGDSAPAAGVDRDELVGPDGTPSAAVVHWLEQLHGAVPVVRAGQPARQRPLTPVRLRYPLRRGGTGYLVGHPEPLTLGPNLRVEGSSSCVMLLTPGTAAYLTSLRRDLDRGRLTVDQAARLVVRPPGRRQLAAAVRALRLPGPGDLPAFFALASGFRDGRPLTVAARLRNLPLTMSTVTGVPLALAAREVLRGRHRAGVHAPEQILPARALLEQLREIPALRHPDGSGPQLEVVDSSDGRQ